MLAASSAKLPSSKTCRLWWGLASMRASGSSRAPSRSLPGSWEVISTANGSRDGLAGIDHLVLEIGCQRAVGIARRLAAAIAGQGHAGSGGVVGFGVGRDRSQQNNPGLRALGGDTLGHRFVMALTVVLHR